MSSYPLVTLIRRWEWQDRSLTARSKSGKPSNIEIHLGGTVMWELRWWHKMPHRNPTQVQVEVDAFNQNHLRLVPVRFSSKRRAGIFTVTYIGNQKQARAGQLEISIPDTKYKILVRRQVWMGIITRTTPRKAAVLDLWIR